jgi:hypothetical protein
MACITSLNLVMSKRVLLLCLPILVASLLVCNGCSSREAQAQKMFEKGQYQEVMDKYADLEVGRRARAKVAEQLVTDKKYSEVIAKFGDTPAAFKAKNEIARQLFEAGRYQTVVDSYPASPQAAAAKDKLVDSLIAIAAYDTLFRRFPDVPRATALKDSMANSDLDKAKKLKGKAKEEAFEATMRKWPGTAAYKEASRLQQELKNKK